jgi:hypothetical protein
MHSLHFVLMTNLLFTYLSCMVHQKRGNCLDCLRYRFLFHHNSRLRFKGLSSLVQQDFFARSKLPSHFEHSFDQGKLRVTEVVSRPTQCLRPLASHFFLVIYSLKQVSILHQFIAFSNFLLPCIIFGLSYKSIRNLLDLRIVSPFVNLL